MDVSDLHAAADLPSYQVNSKLYGPQNQSGCIGEENNPPLHAGNITLIVQLEANQPLTDWAIT
jgi:hypothetical protein